MGAKGASFDHEQLPRTLFGRQDLFMLRVDGDTMVEAGILSGDMVVVARAEQVNDGDIVAVLLPGESAALLRYFRDGDQIRLQPENPLMEPILTREAEIIGRVVGVVRTRVH